MAGSSRAEVNFYNVGRNADELLRKMEANAYLIEPPGGSLPGQVAPRGQDTQAQREAGGQSL